MVSQTQIIWVHELAAPMYPVSAMSSTTEEAGGYFTLEHAVLLAVTSLILLLSLVTLTHLNAWYWTAHVLRQATTRNTLSQRRSRGIKSRHHRSTASSEQLVGENGDIAHTASGGYRRRVGSERMRRQPRSALKIGYLQRPCRGYTPVCQSVCLSLSCLFKWNLFSLLVAAKELKQKSIASESCI